MARKKKGKGRKHELKDEVPADSRSQVPEGDCISSQPREELWSKLPEDVAADILCRLPWLHAVRVQLVCRGWRDLVANHYLPEHAVSGDLLTPIRFRIRNRNLEWCGWDSAAASWRRLPRLNFLGPTYKGEIWMLASHKGLVLGQRRHREANYWARSYFVCNPLTKMFRALPSLSGFVRAADAWHLQVDADGKAYSVRAVAVTSNIFNGDPPELLKYDSRLGACSWALVHAGIARPRADPFRTESSVLVTHGLLYVTTSGHFNTRQDVMELNMRTGVWRRACCVSPMKIAGDVRLWGDRIMVFTVDEVPKQICVHSFLPGASSEVVVESRSGAEFQDWVDKRERWADAEWDGRTGIWCLLSRSRKQTTAECLVYDCSSRVVYDCSSRVWQPALQLGDLYGDSGSFPDESDSGPFPGEGRRTAKSLTEFEFGMRTAP